MPKVTHENKFVNRLIGAAQGYRIIRGLLFFFLILNIVVKFRAEEGR